MFGNVWCGIGDVHFESVLKNLYVCSRRLLKLSDMFHG